MSNSASLAFYIITFLASGILVYLGNKERAVRRVFVLGRYRMVINPLLIAGVIIPILVAGLRQDVGSDFRSYVVEYDAAIQGGSYLEFGFNVVANLSNFITGSPVFMFVAFSALTVIPVMLGINKSTAVRREYRWLLWVLFLFIVFPQTLNMLRQGASVAIGFYIIISIIESHKLFKLSHILGLILAVSFHASAWILVPLGCIAHLSNKMSLKSLLLSVPLLSVLAIGLFSVMTHLLTWLGFGVDYIEGEAVSRSVVPRSLLIVFILMMCWKFYRVLKISNSYSVLVFIGLIFSNRGYSIQ
jgi:hypothetical protein